MRGFYLLFMLLFFASCDRSPRINQSATKIEFSKEGEIWGERIVHNEGKLWLRKKITISESLEPSSSIGLGISMLASYNVYWDGSLIGRNGLPGQTKEEEKVGNVKSFHFLPAELLNVGEHEVLIEYSNFYDDELRIYIIHLSTFEKFYVAPLLTTAFIHIYAGLFLIIGLFYFVRYFINRDDPTSLLFSLLCLLFFALIIIEYLITYYSYAYPLHWTRLQVIYLITVGISILTPLFFVYKFDFKQKLKWMIPSMVVIFGFLFLIPLGYDLATGLTMLLGFVISAAICGRAKYLERKGATINLVVLVPLVLVLIVFSVYYDFLLYIGFGFLILVNLVGIALREREDRKEKEAAKLTSSRLKLELLKKNLQPHFLNNSITSAIDWIERNPSKGVELLFALSKEFDILNDISDKKLIPVIKELDLCRAHIEIMSFRKEEKYGLITTGIDEYKTIPPAVFLTVIENGITHKNSKEVTMTFHVTASHIDNITEYRILAEGGASNIESLITEGTGTKYIKARLQESYPDSWSFKSGPSEKGWESVFEVRDNV